MSASPAPRIDDTEFVPQPNQLTLSKVVAAKKSVSQMLADRPRTTCVTVSPGDFGTKYLMIENLDGAHNRLVNRAEVREIGRDLSAILETTLYLIVDGDKWYILDGQHRIAAISEYALAPIEMMACVYTLEQVRRRGGVIKMLKDLNKGRHHNGADKLCILQQNSPWVPIFAEFGLDPAFDKGRTHLTWNNVMSAVAVMNRSIEASSFTRSGDFSSHEEEFKSYSDDDIRTVARDLRRWVKIADAVKTERKITSLYGYRPMGIYLLACLENHGSPAMSGLETRILNYPELRKLVNLAGSASEELFKEMLRAFNYKQTKHVITVFGKTGRE